MTTVTISIPESLKEFVVRQMKTKGFGNVSEYFRTLLRRAQEQEADTRLEAFLLDGLDSGKDMELNREFWKDLKTEAGRLLKNRRQTS